MCHCRWKMAHLSWTKFLWCKPLLLLSSTFHLADPELWGCAIFGPKMVHLPQTNFFWKIIDIILMYLLDPFILQTFRKILPVDPELWECAIFRPKMALFPKRDFFRKPVNEPCLIHSCLSTWQKSKPDIYLLLKYWQLKNTEISLAKSFFWLKLENQIFLRHAVFAEC